MECELKCSKQCRGKFREPGYSVNIKLSPFDSPAREEHILKFWLEVSLHQ